MFFCFILCARSRLGSFVLGVMLHYSLLAVCSFTSNGLLLLVHGQRHISIEERITKKKQNKQTKKVIKFPNQSNIITLVQQQG